MPQVMQPKSPAFGLGVEAIELLCQVLCITFAATICGYLTGRFYSYRNQWVRGEPIRMTHLALMILLSGHQSLLEHHGTGP